MSPTKTCPQCGAAYGAEQRFCARDGAALRGAASNGSLVGEVLAERYLVQARLGEGGMGEVYRAEHVRMRRPCAVKVLRPSVAADPEAVSRFNREAANASRVAHPNVAAVYDFGETADGLIYLAMELVEGGPLRALLDETGALPPARALAIVAQIAGALDAAHALGIVHRDLKPDNVMLARAADGADVVKVVDFGIAKGGDAAQQVTRTGLIVGTPEFMSPEQLAGDPVDARSDVYALALLAYAMLTGAHPFPAETVQDTLVLRLTTEPRRLSELRPDVPWPAAVQTVLDGGLARRAADRTASAGELARALAAAYEGGASSEPAGAPDAATQILDRTTFAVPPTRVAQARTGAGPAPRRRGARRVAAAVAATLVAGVLGTLAWAGRPAASMPDATRAVGDTSAPPPEPAPTAARPGPTDAPNAGPIPEAGDSPTLLATTATAREQRRSLAASPPQLSGGAAGSTDEGLAPPGPAAARSAEDEAARLATVEQLIESATTDAVAIAAALHEVGRVAAASPPASIRWYRARVDETMLTYMLRDGVTDRRWCMRAHAVPHSALRSAIPNNTLRTSFELLRQGCDSTSRSRVSSP